jgi:glycosyltransferase involved in cell wall biosynthesis
VTRCRRLNICLISEEFPPETGWGGIGSYSFIVARGLAALGHRVHVIARCWGVRRLEQIDGVQLHRIPIPEPSWRRGTWFINIRFPESRQVLLWSLQASRAVEEIHAREELDLVESPEYHAQGLMTSLRQDRTPLVIRLHTPAFLCRRINGVGFGGSRLDTLLSERAEQWTARRARMITSPSRALADDVAREWTMRPNALQIIPNPIDEELFRPLEHLNGYEPKVLFVGRLERRKGVQTLINAWPDVNRAVPAARLVLVGNDHESGPDGGSMKAHLLACLKEAGVAQESVRFVGGVDRNRLPEIYNSAQVCVVPSLYENFPYTCLEAMACGCAVVASRVGGIREIIEDQANGLLVPAQDRASLAAAIVSVLRSASLRNELGRRARQTVVDRFSRAVVCSQTARAYAELSS